MWRPWYLPRYLSYCLMTLRHIQQLGGIGLVVADGIALHIRYPLAVVSVCLRFCLIDDQHTAIKLTFC